MVKFYSKFSISNKILFWGLIVAIIGLVVPIWLHYSEPEKTTNDVPTTMFYLNGVTNKADNGGTIHYGNDGVEVASYGSSSPSFNVMPEGILIDD